MEFKGLVRDSKRLLVAGKRDRNVCASESWTR